MVDAARLKRYAGMLDVFAGGTVSMGAGLSTTSNYRPTPHW
jgi:hypothetical protein